MNTNRAGRTSPASPPTPPDAALSHETAFIADEQQTAGQGLVEYALVLVLVVIVAFIVMVSLGPWVGNAFSNIVNML